MLLALCNLGETGIEMVVYTFMSYGATVTEYTHKVVLSINKHL